MRDALLQHSPTSRITNKFTWYISLIIFDLTATGSSDGKVHVWATDSGKKITVLDANHPGSVQNVKFNPKYMMLASTCTNMVCGISGHVYISSQGLHLVIVLLFISLHSFHFIFAILNNRHSGFRMLMK